MEGRRIYLRIEGDRSMSFPASQFAALETAPQLDLEKVHLNDAGTTLQWDSLDQAVSVEEIIASRFS
ncbi:MAG: DUF2442 domain-containing protein [Candidatus Didemnitutus sp.]|nr:DUF2442 domain-containing protein [Candidatus Didemnitutus sp.]